jgi:hypothetical protein
MVPSQLLTRSNYFMEWLFGTTSEADRTLLKKILKDTDPVFLRWAMEKIMGWSNTERLPNTIHIHGTNDRILPLKFIECDFKIRDGGHLMVLDKSKEISDILVSELTRLA